MDPRRRVVYYDQSARFRINPVLQKRFGIEEMFRDFKIGGYKLEGTNVTGERLVCDGLLIAIAIQLPQCGKKIKLMGYKNISVGWKRQGEMSDDAAAFILVCMKPGSIRRAMRRRSVAGVNDTCGHTDKRYYQGLRGYRLILCLHYNNSFVAPPIHRPKRNSRGQQQSSRLNIWMTI